MVGAVMGLYGISGLFSTPKDSNERRRPETHVLGERRGSGEHTWRVDSPEGAHTVTVQSVRGRNIAALDRIVLGEYQSTGYDGDRKYSFAIGEKQQPAETVTQIGWSSDTHRLYVDGHLMQ